MSEKFPSAVESMPIPLITKQKNKDKKNFIQKISPLFWITVIVPTAFSMIYFGIFASDQFTSQSSFVVR